MSLYISLKTLTSLDDLVFFLNEKHYKNRHFLQRINSTFRTAKSEVCHQVVASPSGQICALKMRIRLDSDPQHWFSTSRMSAEYILSESEVNAYYTDESLEV